MPAVAGLDRPLPGAGRQLEERSGELRPERLRNVVEGAVAVVALEHERIRRCRVDRLAGELLERLCCVVSRACTPPVGREVEMTERRAGGQSEARRVGL